MSIYIVDKGVVVKGGKAYSKNDEIELTEAEYANVKELVISKQGKAAQLGNIEYEDMEVSELKALAEERGLEVVATGKTGAVKADYLKALSEA